MYVANHQSYLDIYSLFHLRRPFKARLRTARRHRHSRGAQFISKTSNFLIPIIGWSMYLTGHVPLSRMDRRSQMARPGRSASLPLAHAASAGVPEQVP